MKTKLGMVLGLLAAGVSHAAFADGLAVSAASLDKAARTSLEKQIADERVAHPESFDAVKGVQGYRKAVYSKYRNPKPHVIAELRSLGAAALLPMLDELAFNAPLQGDASDDDMNALRIGLVEAVGSLRDVRARPVLSAVFVSPDVSSAVRVAAGHALGRLGGDDDLALLEKLEAAGDAFQLAAIGGLGECRRTEAAKDIASLIDTTQDDATAKALAKAAGGLGSSWAWKTLGASAEKTGLEVRETLAKSLVPAFARWHDETRTGMSKAILMLDHPALPDLISKERAKADSDTQRDLDALADMVNAHLRH